MNQFEAVQSAKILATYGIHPKKETETQNVVSHDENGKEILAKEFDPGKQDVVDLTKED